MKNGPIKWPSPAVTVAHLKCACKHTDSKVLPCIEEKMSDPCTVPPFKSPHDWNPNGEKKNSVHSNKCPHQFYSHLIAVSEGAAARSFCNHSGLRPL